MVLVELPGINIDYYFQGSYIELLDSVEYTWLGDLVINDNGAPKIDTNHDGRIKLFYKLDKVFGEIIIDSMSYLLRDLTDGLTALVLQNEPDSADICGADDSDLGGFKEDGDIQSRSIEICPVKLLVCYTEAARERAPDILDQIEMGVHTANNILRNSGIETHAPFIVKELYEIPENVWMESGNPDDRDAIAGIEEVIELREENKCDVVIVITDEVYEPFSGAVAAFGLDDGSMIDSAYALIEYNFINGQFMTMSHEIFHLFNARHHYGPEMCPQTGDEEGNLWAHGFLINLQSNGTIKNNTRWTIMATCLQDIQPGKVKKVEHLSNPSVKYKRCPTGDAEFADNARQLDQNACLVSEYFDDTDELPMVFIQGSAEVCVNTAVNLTGVIENISTPHFYTWRYSEHGVDWSSPYTSSSPSYSFNQSFPIGAVIFIELTAGNVNSPTAKVYKAIRVTDDGEVCNRSATYIQSESKIGSLLQISPVPCKDFLNIDLEVPAFGQNTKFSFFIYDLLGNIRGYKIASNFPVSIETNHIDIGFYTLVVLNENHFSSHHFIKAE